MCTVTFIPRAHGFLLAMNRDEQIARGTAVPPTQVSLGAVRAIYPRDTEGGTWIGVNSRGATFALLNWNDAAALAKKGQSRGRVIPGLLASADRREAQGELDRMELNGMLPFRLIGIFGAEERVWEWRWDQRSLAGRDLSWEARHWFSSGLSDEEAARARGAACALAWRQGDAGSLAWLRNLHASHDPAPGPFSICVHREGVETLSYSEIECTPRQIYFRYSAGLPCRISPPQHCLDLQRVTRLAASERV